MTMQRFISFGIHFNRIFGKEISLNSSQHSHRVKFCSMSSTYCKNANTTGHRGTSPLPALPVPEHRATNLSAVSLALLSPRALHSTDASPLPSPCCSPPPSIPRSGYLSEAKAALATAIAKRNQKTSTLSIDEDMRDMCQYYNLLGTEEKEQFLIHLCTEHSTNHSAVLETAANPPQDLTQPGALSRWEERLRQSLQPPHAWVVTQVSRLTGGVKFLVDLRHHVLQLLQRGRDTPEEDAAVRELDATLREMLSLWFTVGLLQLSRVTWESSCSMLQKISEYEAVHPVRNWTDLKRRVGQYRRCFVFTHSCMPSEPLVVLHTFLTDSISSSMNVIVQNPRFDPSEDRVDIPEEEEDSRTITAAVFYSITSTQKGLQSIELGNYLIKRVVKELMAELPSLCMFSSLSPIPGFTKWLQSLLGRAARGEIRLFSDAEISELGRLLESSSTLELPTADKGSPSEGRPRPSDDASRPSSPENNAEDADDIRDPVTSHETRTVCRRVRQMLATNSWAQDEAFRRALEAPFMRLCAHYLYAEKRRGYALNSVAHFHLKNGAVMWRINYEADMTPRGLSNSCGIMVNYRYFLQDSESNSREYQEHQMITADPSVVTLASAALQVMRNERPIALPA
ncbi:malonyl-CoA decarboxylase, mitochondrial isoform X2 [Hyalella azteca]|uniref:Malonyl-CoA decarboxylase, mitochondrial isoform X2 n=1 Tax=Hyalella azteca TaxID=294128 RepID=A0A979FLD9_HYAAZ|nr:malonyl-CoA decarboxylase, mitochondrial isoform X2 [Hyalella azteca]